MNTNRRSDDSWIIFVIGGIVALFAYLVWQFSTLFGLDMSTGASVFFRLLFLAALVGGAWWFGNDFDIIKLSNIWPIVLALFWACWWPALDYWSSQTGVRFSALAYDQSSPSLMDSDTVWWAAWYTKGGIFAAILGLGYLGKRIFQSDY
ncbi:hypothetical protein BAR24066_07381 [Burkholderia arboris]|uniref:Uncharacterized protein n=1 Tax=Burkholderia arboris TaxID=488730 RepID=A0A9Q9SRQ8_9BURK|nr:hypothetical protein [Burkholderia arboris]VWC46165.1 hypothetical protein BAR24066_07381 [Burkholderia arboris]